MSISDESERASMNAELVDIESNVLHWFNMVDRVSAAGYAKGLEGYQIMLMGNVDYSKLHWVD